jgi:hypothetical protein
MEFYKGRLIDYSLGDFVNYDGFALNGDLDLSHILHVTLTATGSFVFSAIHLGRASRRRASLRRPERRRGALREPTLKGRLWSGRGSGSAEWSDWPSEVTLSSLRRIDAASRVIEDGG